jgi:hypothetical protein
MDTRLPPEADALLAFARADARTSARAFVLACPRCGTFYAYEYDPGDKSPTSGYGESLVRPSPERALELLEARYASARAWLSSRVSRVPPRA